MEDQLDLLQGGSKLRKRLLASSLTLSCMIIAIFCYIGHNLLVEMEMSLESQTYNDQFSDVAELVSASSNSSSNADFDAVPEGAYGLITDKAQAILFNDTPLYIHLTAPNVLSRLLSARQKENGFFDVGEQQYYVKEDILDSGNHLVIVWKARDLSLISDEVISRLAIAAFLTFWLAVWTALVMSAFIARRFETANKALENLALTDTLTQLQNRNALVSVTPLRNSPGALFFMDLDRFRDINEALGHDMGDKLLVAFAQRLKQVAPENAEIYRYRSDEFVLWIPDIKIETVVTRAFTLLYECREPLKIGRSSLEIGCSIGIAYAPEHGRHSDILIRNAETAMLRAKRLRLGIQMYNEHLAYNSTLKVTLRSQLHSALHDNQFILYYQPKVEINNSRLAGVEAIVRWQHPEKGLLSPGDFIDLIEQGGIVHAFTRYTVELAISQIKTWLDRGISLPVSVNLSAYNLMDNAFIPFVKRQLEKSGIPPALLEFELTESATMVDISISKRVLKAFRELGIRTSIDDFGTGMSSFAYLHHLEINTVKLDQSFISDLSPETKNEKIVEGIVSLCRKLEIEVVAEGVENRVQADLLQKLQCKIAQGYYYGRPMPASKIETLIEQSPNDPYLRLVSQ